MRLRHHPDLHKTIAFAGIHLAIAVSLGWLLTGSLVLAGALSLVEPALNTVVHYALDRRLHAWAPLARTLAFGASHFVVAIGVGWALTGSWALAGALAFVEPLANTVAHYVFERWWARRAAREAAPARDQAAVPAT